MRWILIIVCLLLTGCSAKPGGQSFGLNAIINIGGCVRVHEQHYVPPQQPEERRCR